MLFIIDNMLRISLVSREDASSGGIDSTELAHVQNCSGVDPGGEGGNRPLSPIKKTGARVSFCPLNVLAFVS